MASGSFSVSTGNQYIVGACYWDSSANISNNTSTVHMHLHFSRTNSYTTWGSGTFWLNCDGQSWENSLSFSVSQDSNTLTVDANFTVGHNSDGTKSIHMEAGGSSDVFSVNTGSADVGLDNIPRASSISSIVGTTPGDTRVVIGAPSRVGITRASDGFVHNVYYRRPNGSDLLIGASVGTTCDFTIDMNDCSYLPNSTSGTAWIIVETISGGAVVGSATSAMTIYVPDTVNTRPYDLTLSVTDNMGYAATYGGYIKTLSKVRSIVTSKFRYGATVKTVNISIYWAGYTESLYGYDTCSGVCQSAGTISVVASVTDSRGFTSYKSIGISVKDYSPPKITAFSASRCTQAGVADDSGGYVKVTMAGIITSFGAEPNNGKMFALFMKEPTTSSWGNAIFAYEAAFTLSTVYQITVNTEKSYDLLFRINDQFTNVDLTMQLSTAFAIMDFKNGGKGIAFGKVASRDGIDIDTVKMPVYMNNLTIKQYMLNMLHPIDSLYLTATATNPGTYLGGTWAQMQSGYLYAGTAWAWQGSNVTSGTAITEAQMPAHSHDHKVNVGHDDYSFDGINTGLQAGDDNNTAWRPGYGTDSHGGGQPHTHSVEPYRLSVFVWVRQA